MWSFESHLEKVERLERMIRVIKKAIKNPPSKYSESQKKSDKERLSHLTSQLKLITKNS
jgi:hypothetical protein